MKPFDNALRPGIKALTLPHPRMLGDQNYRRVTVASEPQQRNIYDYRNVLYTDVVCFIEYDDADGLPERPAGCVGWGWPAKALMPLPPDDAFDDERYKSSVVDKLHVTVSVKA